jgi:hypothetical protein
MISSGRDIIPSPQVSSTLVAINRTGFFPVREVTDSAKRDPWWIDRYIKMATLSLYFFNLLPLPLLDGAQLLDVILTFSVYHTTQINIDLEAVEISHPRRQKLSTTVIYVVTTVLFCVAIIFTILPLRWSRNNGHLATLHAQDRASIQTDGPGLLW